jgi:hypothetical protein
VPAVSEIWVSLGVDLKEFKNQTREASGMAAAMAAKVSDAFSRVKVNTSSLSAVSRELNGLKARASELRAALVNAQPRRAPTRRRGAIRPSDRHGPASGLPVSLNGRPVATGAGCR